jgi:Methyltransferase domain
VVDGSTQSRPYRQQVQEELGWEEAVPISCLVTGEDVFDFVILYESLLETWTFFPFRLHAFVLGRDAGDALSALNLPKVELHLGEAGAAPAERAKGRVRMPSLVERSRLERCLVSAPDNVFCAETPELFMLLDRYDLVFTASPRGVPQTSLWSFRRNERTIRFSRRWGRLLENAEVADAGRLPPGLLENRDPNLSIKVLVHPAPGRRRGWHASPYDVQMNLRPSSIRRDTFGFREKQMGRAKVVHAAGLRGKTNDSVKSRVSLLVRRFPQWAEFFPVYVTLANRAAKRLGRESLANPLGYLQKQIDEAGIVAHREQLPELLNRRRLFGRGVEVGVQRGDFSELILLNWHGRELISVDPWLAAPPDEYRDVSNLPQEIHDNFYAEARRRLEVFGDRSKIWRMTSKEAAARIESRSLDFVYLDARHDYESVKEDIELWYDKVRPGGILAGHDYVDGVRPQGVFGVKSAVDEFFAARGLTVGATLDNPWPSWIVKLPGKPGGIAP